MEDALKIRNKHVAFLASFHNPSVIFEQISVIYALPRLFVGSFTLVLPFFPTGTLERVCAAQGRAGACPPQHASWPMGDHTLLLGLPGSHTSMVAIHLA